MTVIEHIAVVVPAHDEAERIGAALSAITRARCALPSSVTSATIVVVDSSHDSTAAIVAPHLHQPFDQLLEVSAGSVGAARAAGTAAALAATPVGAERTWLANTDADTLVPADWLCRQLAEAEAGAVGLAGVVTLRDDETVDPHVRMQFTCAYGADLRDDHSHVHGANLGVRADAYVAVGGWRPLEHSEDHDLWRRLTECSPVRALGSLTVATSPRRVGRAPWGFAGDIGTLCDGDGVVA